MNCALETPIRLRLAIHEGEQEQADHGQKGAEGVWERMQHHAESKPVRLADEVEVIWRGVCCRLQP